jgi:cell division septum initiation protein DivIVA
MTATEMLQAVVDKMHVLNDENREQKTLLEELQTAAAERTERIEDLELELASAHETVNRVLQLPLICLVAVALQM